MALIQDNAIDLVTCVHVQCRSKTVYNFTGLPSQNLENIGTMNAILIYNELQISLMKIYDYDVTKINEYSVCVCLLKQFYSVSKSNSVTYELYMYVYKSSSICMVYYVD